MSRLAIWLLCVALFGAEKKPKPEKYDPDNLPENEVACGRHKTAAPCKCMSYREINRNSALELCDAEPDKVKRMACWSAVPACPAVIDVDHRYQMPAGVPAQCSRSCSKARCGCCHT